VLGNFFVQVFMKYRHTLVGHGFAKFKARQDR
jgi:hypothetical protein